MTAAETSAPGRLMLLDSASMYFRAFFGVPEIKAPDGTPVNAVRGFLDFISRLVSDYQPSDLVCCWDNDWRPAFRVEAIPTYKTHRLAAGSDVVEETPPDLVPQVPVIVDALAALGVARVGADGYEADDVIGTLTHQARGRSCVDVVTGDRDLFQLVDDDAAVRVLYTARGGVRDADVVTQEFLQAKYAVATGAAYADMAALRGDTSDGLPGVAGIGEKTAATLINRYGDLAGLRRALAEGDPQIKGVQRARLEAASAYLDVAPTVVQVARDAPVGDVPASLPTKVADPVLLSRLAADYGLATTFTRFLDALGVHGA